MDDPLEINIEIDELVKGSSDFNPLFVLWIHLLHES
jgi:hypothetical protein